MHVNWAAWTPVILLGALAYAALELDRRLSLSKGAVVLEAIAGPAGIVLALGAGIYLRETFVGRGVVPWFAGFGTGARLTVTVVAALTVAAALLAAVPARWSPTVAASLGLAAAVVLLPSLLPYMVASGFTDAVRGVVEPASQMAVALSAKVL